MKRNASIMLAALAAALTISCGLALPAHAQATLVFPAPQAPATVLGYPQSGAVFLTWTNLPDAAVVAYNAYRRTADQTAEKATRVNAQPLTTTFVTDNGLTNGTPYVYFVKSVYRDAAGKLFEGPASRDVGVTPMAPILDAFVLYNIDTPYPGGVTVNSANVLTIRGSGIDLWDGNDGHTFLAAPVAGDFTITAKLLGPPVKETSLVTNFANVGIEIRAGVGVTDQYALLKTHANRLPAYYFEGRIEYGTNFSQTANSPTFARFPVVFRLTRRGTIVSAAYSEDNGITFTNLVDARDFKSLPPVLYAGVYASARSPGPLFVAGNFDLNSLKITAPQ